MAAALAARLFRARKIDPQTRARLVIARLRWAVVAMVLFNAIVWGGVIATARGLVDIPQLVDQAWAWGAAWIAVISHLDITISH
jgi:hypothetical protein